jgi:hypothetical protein
MDNDNDFIPQAPLSGPSAAEVGAVFPVPLAPALIRALSDAGTAVSLPAPLFSYPAVGAGANVAVSSAAPPLSTSAAGAGAGAASFLAAPPLNLSAVSAGACAVSSAAPPFSWPQHFSSNCEELRVQWQWLRPKPVHLKSEDAAHKFITRGTSALVEDYSESASGGWLPIEDDLILQQLKQRTSLIQYGQHKYKLSPSWFIVPDDSDTFGEGPLVGSRIRWVPDVSLTVEDDIEQDTGGYDDMEQLAVHQMDYEISLFPFSAHSSLDQEHVSFPELGSAMMADAFTASLRLGCSEDILLLAAFIKKIPPQSQNHVVCSGLKLLPAASDPALPHGDISVVLEIMRRIISVIPSRSLQEPVTKEIVMGSITSWCSKHGLDVYNRPLYKAYLEFQRMQAFYLSKRPPPGVDHYRSHPIFFRMNTPRKSFDSLGRLWNGFPFGRKNPDGSPDMRCQENYEVNTLVRGSSIVKVVEALSEGYPGNFFVHCAELDGPVGSYSRVTDRGDGGDRKGEPMKTYYILHSNSSLAKADKTQFTAVFAISSTMLGAEMKDASEPFRLGALGLAEPCPVEVFPNNHESEITRRIALHADDKVPPASGREEIVRNGKRFLELTGSARSVITRELQIRKDPALRVAGQKIKLADAVKDQLQHEPHFWKLKALQEMEDNHLFKSISCMSKNLYNSKLDIHVTDSHDFSIEFTGRRQQLAVLQEHVQSWFKRLSFCFKIKVDADDLINGLEHYRFPDPKNFGGKHDLEYKAFMKRLHNVTAEDLCEEEIFEMTQGKDFTRESRMEAVARIALQIFECRIVGGFVRDWIVNGDRKHPSGPPRDWVEVSKVYESKEPPDSYHGWLKWDFKPDVQVIPKDVDIELMTQYFDVNRFIHEVTKYGIVVDHYRHIPQRHFFLFDRETGPFTADFIEPQLACISTFGEFNVNCLCVSRFPDQVGLKLEYRSSSGEHILEVNPVIADCRKRQLFPMYEGVDERMKQRTMKMRDRGYFVIGVLVCILHLYFH